MVGYRLNLHSHMAEKAYQPSDKTRAMYENYSLVSRVKNASYGNNVFKTDAQFAGLSLADCVMKVLDDDTLTAQFLEENEEYRENNTLATFLFGQYRKTGRTPRDLNSQNDKVKELFEKKKDAFINKFID